MSYREPSPAQEASEGASDPDRPTLRRPDILQSSRASTSNVASDTRNSHPGYHTITANAPASNRPLWSLGATLPRVRRINSRAGSVAAKATSANHPTEDILLSEQPSSPPPVHAHDFAEEESPDLDESATRPSYEQVHTLPKIEEQAPLSTSAIAGDSSSRLDLGRQTSGPDHDPDNQLKNPQATLSDARRQLLEEAQLSQNAEAVESSAVDAGPDMPPVSTLSHHVKTASLPVLPSQEPRYTEKNSSHTIPNSTSRQSGETSEKSALQKTRHPGLSGARPVPRGRTAGGPAVGFGTRRPSTQNDSATPRLPPDGPRTQSSDYFGNVSNQSQSISVSGPHDQDGGVVDQADELPVGGRSQSMRSTARDTRNAWMKRNMPSLADKDRDDEQGETNSQDTAVPASSMRSNQNVWLSGQDVAQDGTILFPTFLSKWRYRGREFLAEMLASMLLLVVGTSVDCQVALSQSMGSNAGSYTNQNWAWGIAVASTIYLSGGRSGAHCNPAITLGLAVYRGFPWKQIPIYWAAQLLGSFLGAAITYGIYLPALDAYEGGRHVRTLTGPHGTGRLFVTVPELVFTQGSGFATEVTATSILMAMVLAVGDETNAPPSDGLSALILGLVVVMIGMSLGWPTSYAISPSRDLGPRILLSMLGYGSELWTHNSYWWIYGPICGCLVGALIGGLLYDLAIFTGEESPINYTSQGWAQSTPAVLTARLLNAADRFRFIYPRAYKTSQDDTDKAMSKLHSAVTVSSRRSSPSSQRLGQQEQGLSEAQT